MTVGPLYRDGRTRGLEPVRVPSPLSLTPEGACPHRDNSNGHGLEL